jgi:hypothetical protein
MTLRASAADHSTWRLPVVAFAVIATIILDVTGGAVMMWPTSRREDNRSSRRRADNRAAEAARVIKGSTSRMTAIVEVSL